MGISDCNFYDHLGFIMDAAKSKNAFEMTIFIKTPCKVIVNCGVE